MSSSAALWIRIRIRIEIEKGLPSVNSALITFSGFCSKFDLASSGNESPWVEEEGKEGREDGGKEERG